MTTTDAGRAQVARSTPGSYFLRKFLRDPKRIASVWPSSRWLAEAMLDGLEFRPGDGVVELGPGTGPFTDLVMERLRGLPGVQYLGVDRDGDFCKLLRERHPSGEFVQADAFDLPALLAARPSFRPVAVLSGLPLVSMPRQGVGALIEAIARDLTPGGQFRTFSYWHSILNPAQWWLRRHMRATFARFSVIGPVLRNVPPAVVFAGRKAD